MNGPTAEALYRRIVAMPDEEHSNLSEALIYLHELVVNAKSLLMRYAEADAFLAGDDTFIDRWLESARGIE